VIGSGLGRRRQWAGAPSAVGWGAVGSGLGCRRQWAGARSAVGWVAVDSRFGCDSPLHVVCACCFSTRGGVFQLEVVGLPARSIWVPSSKYNCLYRGVREALGKRTESVVEGLGRCSGWRLLRVAVGAGALPDAEPGQLVEGRRRGWRIDDVGRGTGVEGGKVAIGE